MPFEAKKRIATATEIINLFCKGENVFTREEKRETMYDECMLYCDCIVLFCIVIYCIVCMLRAMKRYSICGAN